MKKLLSLFLLFFISVTCFSQTKKTTSQSSKKAPKFYYKVGLVSSLPTDTYKDQNKISIGSTFFEASYIRSKKVHITANSGYLRYANDGESYAQIPVLIGVKYRIDNMFHFGASGGGVFFNTKGDANFMFSPFIGIQANKISFDVRYFNTLRKENSIKTTALVFSYTL